MNFGDILAGSIFLMLLALALAGMWQVLMAVLSGDLRRSARQVHRHGNEQDAPAYGRGVHVPAYDGKMAAERAMWERTMIGYRLQGRKHSDEETAQLVLEVLEIGAFEESDLELEAPAEEPVDKKRKVDLSKCDPYVSVYPLPNAIIPLEPYSSDATGQDLQGLWDKSDIWIDPDLED